MHGVLLGLLAAGCAAPSAPCAGPRSAGLGAAGMAGDLMGVNDVRVARVERQWRLLPAGRSGAAPADADLPHRRSPFLSDCGCADRCPRRVSAEAGLLEDRAAGAGAGLAVARIENSHSISPVGVRFCPARYEAPQGQDVTRRCPAGWNLRWRHRARKCRSARCRDWQRRQPVGAGPASCAKTGLHLQAGRNALLPGRVGCTRNVRGNAAARPVALRCASWRRDCAGQPATMMGLPRQRHEGSLEAVSVQVSGD